MMILVTGATGNFGREAIEFLLKKGIPAKSIAAFGRSEEKTASLHKSGVQVRLGNYDDYVSLLKAFKGIDKLLFVSGSEVEKRDKQHDNIIKAAKESSVKHIIYTSFERSSDDQNSPISFITNSHVLTEKKIIDTGLIYTLLRNALYAEGLPLFIGKDAPDKGIYFPAADGRVPFASRTDMAEAAANIAAGQGHENQSYHTVNSHSYSFYEIAAILSEITGKEVKYFCPSSEEFSKSLVAEGVPENVIKGILGWAGGIRQGYFESKTSDLERLLGRKPVDLKSILAKVYSSKPTVDSH